MSFASPPRQPANGQRGIVLAAALLFILLSSVLVLTLMLTTVGERSQSSNVQTAKLALYAADAGVRTQQQLLANLAKVKMDSCLATWVAAGSNPAQPIVTAPDQMFPVGALGGTNVASSSNPPFAANASIQYSSGDVGPQSQSFNYMYTIQSTGTVMTTGKRSVQSTGSLRMSATRGSFSDYLLLTDQFVTAAGDLMWFTSATNFDGRVHTNAAFKFAYQPTFQDEVTQVGVNATFYNDGNGNVVANAANNGTVDVPNFFGGYLRGQAAIPLPANGGQQEGAALGLALAQGTQPTSTQIDNQLGGPQPNGVYLPNNGLALVGGIYVKGGADLVKMWADTLLNKQYYQITQGGTQRSIQVDPVTSTTQVWNNLTMSGLPAATYLGMPNGVLYSTAGISDLRGPDRTLGYVNPAIAENQRILVAASGDVVIQGDLTCDNYYNKDNVLGIYSAAGAVRIGTSAPNNLDVDAFVMACGTSNGEFRVDNHDTGSPRGSVNLRGGCVSKYYGAFYTFDVNGALATGYARNWHYDRRGLVPPAYPSTLQFRVDTPTARTVAWKEI